jgi:hypothetical protein
VSYGDGPTYPVVRHALGPIDTYLFKPLGDPEERLYPVEILGAWARTPGAARRS